MSNYIKRAVHPKTGKILKAMFIDGYCGKNRYGVGFRLDGKDAEFEDNANTLHFWPEEEVKLPARYYNKGRYEEGGHEHIKQEKENKLLVDALYKKAVKDTKVKLLSEKQLAKLEKEASHPAVEVSEFDKGFAQCVKAIEEWSRLNECDGNTEFNEGVNAAMRYLRSHIKRI